MARIVGIDLGTTNSLVAYLDRGVARIIPDEAGQPLLPSVVSFHKNQICVGQEANAPQVDHAHKTVYSIKRLMGKGLEDIQEDRPFFPSPLRQEGGVIQMEINGELYTPHEVSSLILKELRRRAEVYLHEPVDQAVITVPAYFNNAQREATKDAARIAGLDALRILNEPTAAALAYGLQKKKEGTVAIYDFGGGTFDISILTIQNGIFEVLAANGNTHLGGDDIDRQLIRFILEEIAAQQGVDLGSDPSTLQSLRKIAQAGKCALSFQESFELYFSDLQRGIMYKRLFSRSELEGIMKAVIDQTILPCRLALADAHLRPADLDEVILVGGSTRIPLVQKIVGDFFGKTPHSEINPEEVVALGAAIQADILAGGTTHLLLLDITPLSLGIETMGGVVSRLIPRNTTVPITAKESFTTSVDGQTSVSIHVVQGEREQVADCCSLAQFHLSGLDPLPAGIPRIEVTFMVDANGILNVQAVELRTGKKQAVWVKPSYGLTEDQVSAMVAAARQHEKEDLRVRQLIEARNKGESLLQHVKRGLREGAALMEAVEQQQIEKAMADLIEAQQGTDPLRIEAAMQKLDEVTQHLASVLLKAAFQEAVKEKH